MKKVLKNAVKTVAALIAAVIVFTAVVNLFVCVKSKSRMSSVEDASKKSGYDCILVLGCGVRGNTPSPLLSDRLDAAIALYEAGVAPKLLMSGDHGEIFYNEVSVMRQYAMDRGVPSEDIFLDHAGFSTYESMYRASDVFGVKKAVVVTQKYHLYRAIYDSAAFKIETDGAIATGHIFAEQTYWNIREYAARVKDFLWCIFKPDPTYKGEKVDITGNGEVTLD